MRISTKFLISAWCLIAVFICSGAVNMSAATPAASELLARAVDKLKEAPSLQATFRAVTSEGATSGSILLSGNRFKLDTDDFTTWFDGRTQWAYSPHTNEVNISEPTFEELAQINPFAVISSLKDGYKVRKMQAPKGFDRLELLPKKKGEYAKVVLTLNAATCFPSTVDITGVDGTAVRIDVTSVKVGKAPGTSVFRFNKALYPHAEIVDLR